MEDLGVTGGGGGGSRGVTISYVRDLTVSGLQREAGRGHGKYGQINQFCVRQLRPGLSVRLSSSLSSCLTRRRDGGEVQLGLCGRWGDGTQRSGGWYRDIIIN